MMHSKIRLKIFLMKTIKRIDEYRALRDDKNLFYGERISISSQQQREVKGLFFILSEKRREDPLIMMINAVIDDDGFITIAASDAYELSYAVR